MYTTRSIRFLEVWTHEDWRLKIYGIASRGPAPRSELISEAKGLAHRHLPRPASGAGRYGLGFLGVHEGRGADLVFLDWWQHENELQHHVFTGPVNRPPSLENVTDRGLLGCVWDLVVIGFERQAWVSSMLLGPAAPDAEGYLHARFSGSW